MHAMVQMQGHDCMSDLLAAAVQAAWRKWVGSQQGLLVAAAERAVPSVSGWLEHGFDAFVAKNNLTQVCCLTSTWPRAVCECGSKALHA